MNPRTRIYFFSGLVLLTIAALLLSVVDRTQVSEFQLIFWSVSAISGGAVLILLALAVLFSSKKSQAPISGTARTEIKRNVKRGKDIALLLGKSAALAVLSTVISALLVPMIYGSAVSEQIMIRNAWFICLVLFLIFLALGHFARAFRSWKLG